MNEFFRVYSSLELGGDGYPPEWHETIKHQVRAEASHRCVRCGHPYRNGEHGSGEWSPCDELCSHDPTPCRFVRPAGRPPIVFLLPDRRLGLVRGMLAGHWEAQWRILTVHHLNEDKADCRWWNLAALCQRCHLEIQGRVHLARLWPWEHSDWFKPYAAGWYAAAYLGEELTREETMERLDELLALERIA